MDGEEQERKQRRSPRSEARHLNQVCVFQGPDLCDIRGPLTRGKKRHRKGENTDMGGLGFAPHPPQSAEVRHSCGTIGKSQVYRVLLGSLERA